ncbi:rna-dependent dna polymerase [Lasius niger]|uniref:Rna-dependent dna polymerase n=1 Tax=Lasius niger TaxID=67767 RepID=A0A0J7KAJ4_LASNI|nr:rna-dependent dna polymerase [Lasius niger]
MTSCNSVATPADTSTTLKTSINEDPRNVLYRQLVGSLMYLAVVTRPDLAYTVATLSKFLDSPTDEHWNAGKRVLRYLAGTTDIGIMYGRDRSTKLVAYSDADWANCVNTRRSTSGVVLLNGGPVTWFSRKQGVVATSTTDAEYVAAHDAGKEIVWARRLLKKIGSQIAPYVLWTSVLCPFYYHTSMDII